MTYTVISFAIAILGIVMAAIGSSGSALAQRRGDTGSAARGYYMIFLGLSLVIGGITLPGTSTWLTEQFSPRGDAVTPGLTVVLAFGALIVIVAIVHVFGLLALVISRSVASAAEHRGNRRPVQAPAAETGPVLAGETRASRRETKAGQAP